MRTLLFATSVAVLAAGCASTGGRLAAQPFRCSASNKTDIEIPIELAAQQVGGRTFCVATVVPPDASQPVPRGCRDKHVTWVVKNTCSGTREVMIAFSPFDNNNDTKKNVRPYQNDPQNLGRIKDKIRVKARGTKAGGPGACPADQYEVCGVAYKYDIYVDRRLALDPELEVEY